MVLNYIWIFFFAVAFIVALFRLVIGGDTEVFSAMMTSTFDMSKTGFEISLGLTGVLTLWMGIMKIGERGGAVQVMSGMINPFFRRLFPGLPQDSPAHGSIMMNLAANMLGLDNAATPMGLKAMQQMQEVNTRKDAASNAQIMFLVLNTSGLTIVPVSIMVYRAQLGAANPTDIFIPILLATYFSTLAGLIAVAIYQKINLFDRVILAYLGGISVLMAGVIWYFSTLDKEAVTVVSNVASNIILFGIIMVLNCGIGLLTPPVGSVLFIGSAVSGVKMERVVKATLPFYICMIIVLMLLTFIPEVSLLLPRVFGGYGG